MLKDINQNSPVKAHSVHFVVFHKWNFTDPHDNDVQTKYGEHVGKCKEGLEKTLWESLILACHITV